MITFLARKLKPIRDTISLLDGPNKIPGLVTNPRNFIPVQSGLVSVQFVNDLEFSTLINTVPEGELQLVDDDESLTPTKLAQGKILEHRENEFGRVVHISPKEIKDKAGNIIVGNTQLSFAQSEEQAKSLLVAEAFAKLQMMMTVTVGKLIYGSLFGEAILKRKTGSSKAITFNHTSGGSVTTGWEDVNAAILSDMEAISTALLLQPERKKLSDAKVLMSNIVARYIARNKQIASLFPQFGINSNLFSIPQATLEQTGVLSEWFGERVVGDDVYYENGAPVRYAPEDEIIVVPDAKYAPITEVYIAPTRLDPKYINRDDATGASTHIYDGTADPDSSSEKIGTLTVGLRARVAARKRKSTYGKKVANV